MPPKDVHYVLRIVAKLSIDKASQVLSKMVKNGARIDLEKVYVADISKITRELGVQLKYPSYREGLLAISQGVMDPF